MYIVYMKHFLDKLPIVYVNIYVNMYYMIYRDSTFKYTFYCLKFSNQLIFSKNDYITIVTLLLLGFI